MDWAFPPLLPATRNLLVVLVTAFVVYTLLMAGLDLPANHWLGLGAAPSIAWAWQWATHWMVVGSDPGVVTRVLLSMFFLYLVGAQYEALAGARHTYGITAASVVGAAVGIMATAWITPGPPFGDFAATYAMMAGLAVRVGPRPVRFLGFPPTSAWAPVVLFGVLALFQALWSRFAPVFGAYAGAVLAGYAYERAVTLRAGQRRKSGRAGSMGGRSFRVIEGGRSDDERPPRYWN